jgi:hypothetical protein
MWDQEDEPALARGVRDYWPFAKRGMVMFDKKEIIQKLRGELDVLAEGGYAPSVESPHWMPRVFRDSVSCPNLGLDFKIEPCSDCFLTYFVPPEHRDKEVPCHYIPLNDQGETIHSLGGQGYQVLRPALQSWLQTTISRLENEPDFPIGIHQAEKLLPGAPQPLFLR